MKRLAAIWMVLISLPVFGQDAQFTQFFSAPMYLNPAFTGVNLQNRLVLNYRSQWPDVPKAFVTSSVSYDRNLSDINSGVGINVFRDKAGIAALRYTKVAVQYAYQFRLNYKYYIRAGIDFGYVWRTINMNELVFGDQLVRGGGFTTLDFVDQDKVEYADFSSGALFYSSKFWVGTSIHHINQPNQSLVGEISRLPYKFSLHGGAKLKLEDVFKKAVDNYIYPAFNYKSQGKFDQLDVGFYYERDPLILGFWYRGIPGLKAYEPGYQNNDAVMALVGVKWRNMRIGYSYDLTISRLAINTGGSHEISMSYEWAERKKKPNENLRNVPCPKF